MSNRTPLSHFDLFLLTVLTNQLILKISTANPDSPRVEIVKRLINNNTGQYLQEQFRITNKAAIQWYEYCREICTANMQKNRRQWPGPGQEIQRTYTIWTLFEEYFVWNKNNVANWSSPLKMKRETFLNFVFYLKVWFLLYIISKKIMSVLLKDILEGMVQRYTSTFMPFHCRKMRRKQKYKSDAA